MRGRLVALFRQGRAGKAAAVLPLEIRQSATRYKGTKGLICLHERLPFVALIPQGGPLREGNIYNLSARTALIFNRVLA